MGYRILALLEDNVATTLLLTSRLAEVGHRLVIVSRIDAFQKRLEAEQFDWIVLDAAVTRADSRRLRSVLARLQGIARIAWLGARPPFAGVAIAVAFSTPPAYDAIAETFRRFWINDESGMPPRPDHERRVHP